MQHNQSRVVKFSWEINTFVWKEIVNNEEDSVLDSLLSSEAGNSSKTAACPGLEEMVLYNLPGLCFPVFELSHYFITAITLRLELGKDRARFVICLEMVAILPPC